MISLGSLQTHSQTSSAAEKLVRVELWETRGVCAAPLVLGCSQVNHGAETGCPGEFQRGCD